MAVDNGVEDGRPITDLLANYRASETITMDITGFDGSSGDLSGGIIDAIARSAANGLNNDAPEIYESEHSMADYQLRRYGSTSDTTVVTNAMARWSENIWDGEAPGRNDTVVINAGETVVLDQSTTVKGIIVNGGELIIEDDANLDIDLSTDYLLVINGGLFQGGTEDDLLDTDFTLTLEGDDPGFDLNVTAALQGRADNIVTPGDAASRAPGRDVVEPGPAPAQPADPAGPATTCNGQDVTVDLAMGDTPTSGDDVILGTAGDDVIHGGAGDDVICGAGGDDTIWGGAGDDMIRGNRGADELRGGEGEDAIFGGRGADEIHGDDGDDRIRGNKGADTIYAGAGNDVVSGGKRADTIVGGSGDDVLRGDRAADTISGGDGDDVLRGGFRPDTLDGGPGLDEYYGGRGLNTCVGDPDGLVEIVIGCGP